MAAPNPVIAKLQASGFQTPQQLLSRFKFRRLMVSIAGPSNTGKTEFGLSGPGLGVALALDRGIEGCLENPYPPTARNPNFLHHIIAAPKAGQLTQQEYVEYWKRFYSKYREVLDIPEVRTVLLDGDADSFELQKLAEWGRVSKVMPTQYESVYAARRVMYNRAYDSGKIFIATARVKKVYAQQFNPDGSPKKADNGMDVREWDGKSYEREGFKDQSYLWQVHLASKFNEDKRRFGVEILMCKMNRDIEGMELWGDDCNVRGLIEAIFPDNDPKEWGF